MGIATWGDMLIVDGSADADVTVAKLKGDGWMDV